MNNTVDVVTQRKAYDALAPLRNSLRAELGVSDKRVLIYSGRIIRGKRIEFLLEAFEKLYSRDPAACLFVVGGGDLAPIIERTTQCFPTGTLRYFGPVSDADMNRLLVAADLYVIPGQVGLAPLTAMCFDLPVVAFDLPIHSPEIEYLTPENSVILPASTTPEEFAEQLPKIFEQFSDPARRAKIYPSIAHLTMEAMVDRFIEGIERVFALDRKA
ncbi:MAG: glycosyltransferase [Candidatus Sumerlaea chitinivorans]|nr:glycosyltransferase [Candidatus Sumerlaea chitinivorans]